MRKLLTNLFQLLRTNSWAFLMFVSLNFFVDSTSKYLILTIITVLSLYLLNKNLSKTIWLSIIFLGFFNKARYFPLDYYGDYFQKIFNDLSLINAQASIHNSFLYISFLDPLIFLLIYLLRFKDSTFGKIRFKAGVLDLAILILIILSFVSCILSPLIGLASFYFWIFFKYILLFYLARIFSQDQEIKKDLFEIILIFTLIFSSIIILQKISGGSLGLIVEDSLGEKFADENRSLYRPGGFFHDSNLAASILLFFLPLNSFLISSKKKVIEILAQVGIILSLLAIFFTMSRAIWFCLLLIMLINFNTIKKSLKKIWKKLRSKEKYLLIAATLVLTPYFLFFSLNRMSSLFVKKNSGDNTLKYRLRHFKNTGYYLKNNLFGLGHNVLKFKIINDLKPEAFSYDPTASHNLFLEITNALGPFGLIAFLYFLKELFLKSKKRKSTLKTKMLSLSLISYLLVAQFYPWLYEFRISAFFWIIAGTYYEE